MMSRAQMEEVIARGGSVLVHGQIIDKVAALPSEAELARGDETRTAAVKKQLQDRRAQVDKELAELEGGPTGETGASGDDTAKVVLQDLTIADLKDFAVKHSIEITATKKDDIIEEISRGLQQ